MCDPSATRFSGQSGGALLTGPGTGREAEVLKDLHRIVLAIAERMAKEPDRGQVAQYIPELAKIDPISSGSRWRWPDGTCSQPGMPTRRSRSRVFQRYSL